MEIEGLIDKYKQFLQEYPQADKHPVFYAQKVQEEGREMLSHADRSPNPEDLELGGKEAGDALLAIIGYSLSMGISIETLIEEATLKIDELGSRYDSGYYDRSPVEEVVIYDP